MAAKPSKTFCILPWIHLAVFPEGSAQMCCIAAGRVRERGVPLSLQTRGLEEVWNSDYMRAARRGMLAGHTIDDCRNCYAAEAGSGSSWRTHSNARWAQELGPLFESVVDQATRHDQVLAGTPIYYQLMPGSLCNLKCRMCFPTYSTLIEKDALHSRWVASVFTDERANVALVPPAQGRPPGAASRLPDGPWYRDDAWVSEVLLRDPASVRGLYFTGGEPMIEPQVEKILDHLLAAGVEGQVTLEFNTNCTVLRDSLVEKILRFKLVSFSLSVDAYGRYNEYIRYPSTWRAVEKNVDRLAALACDRVSVHGGPVLQVYNALNITEVLRFFDQRRLPHAITIAGRPEFLAVNVLPPRVRELAANRLKDYASSSSGSSQASALAAARHMETGPAKWQPGTLRRLMLFTNALDADRRQSARDVHAELLSLLGECGFEWTSESAPEPPRE